MAIETTELDRIIGDHGPSDIPPICLACGYNLTGAVSSRCPECGRICSRKELRQQATELRMRLSELEGLNTWVSAGLRIGVGAFAIRVSGVALGFAGIGSLAYLCRLVALPCGFAAVCLGLSVLRVRRVPAWAREMLPQQPDYWAALGAILLGLALAASSMAPW